MLKKKQPKVNKKGGIIFDSANYELEKTKKAHESDHSDKEKDEKKWYNYTLSSLIISIPYNTLPFSLSNIIFLHNNIFFLIVNSASVCGNFTKHKSIIHNIW